MADISSYRDLRVWQNAVNLAIEVYKSTNEFPKSELYGLTNQIRRAAVSIASNIAEGHRRSTQEYIRFLRIARGSLAELDTQLEIACRIGFLPQEQYSKLSAELDIIGKQLNTLIMRIRAKE